ncbi:MAG: hypothetical protein ACPGWR_19105, partial [Ardenticatenaceae bacterium]
DTYPAYSAGHLESAVGYLSSAVGQLSSEVGNKQARSRFLKSREILLAYWPLKPVHHKAEVAYVIGRLENDFSIDKTNKGKRM